jgi:transcriptional regulator with XRE-family HTH domain
VQDERPEDFVIRVTRRIAEVRRARGMTQDQLAEAMGTATRNVQRLEAGQNLTLHTLSRIASALGVSPSELLAGPVLPPPRYQAPRPQGGAFLHEKPATQPVGDGEDDDPVRPKGGS